MCRHEGGRAKLEWSWIFEAVTGIKQGTCEELELCRTQFVWQCLKGEAILPKEGSSLILTTNEVNL